MFKHYFMLLVFSVVLYFVNGWTVFPLPNTPASAPIKATPVLPRLPIASSKYVSTTKNVVKPTPVLPQFTVQSTTANIPNKFNVLSSTRRPVLSTQGVSVPASDLVPPKVII